MQLSDPKTKKVRKYLINCVVDTGHGINFRQIMDATGVTRQELGEIIVALERGTCIVMERGTENVRMIHPFATVSTPFRVEVKGQRKWFAE